MRDLSLRRRVLMAMGFLAVVQVVTALGVYFVAKDQLLDQIDDRLVATVRSGDASTAHLDWLEQHPDLYQGLVDGDGQMSTLNVLTERGDPASPPVVSAAQLSSAVVGPITVDADDGLDYRVVAMRLDDSSVLVLGTSLRGYEWTINRLEALLVMGVVVGFVVLAAVAWWVVRLGIRPIKEMTQASEAIAAGNLAERIEVTRPGTEAGQLGTALNTMMLRIETAFNEQNESQDRLRQFVADASHELRTPVATIRGYAELYQAGGLDDRVERDDAMGRVADESARMSRLIADMLQLAELDRAPTVRREMLDMVQLVDDLVGDARVAHPHRVIVWNVPGVAATVRGDGDQLRQAISNVIGNALVHTEAQVEVTVSALSDATVPTPDATNAAGETVTMDKSVRIVVTDQGDGMGPEDVERATERFHRADPARSRGRVESKMGGGTGLGLAIVASIVEAHGGELAIESEQGVGTKVSIVLGPDRSSYHVTG